VSAAGTTGAGAPDGGAFDPLALTVWAHTVAMVAEEMGAVLVRAAVSPNIRERRDASAAVFDAAGRMVAQAAHIPVHLGAMPEAVTAVRARGARAGDVFLLNDPAHGGSHLPDLTLVEAVGRPRRPGRDDRLRAVRAHHADVGGMSPGSMPQGATSSCRKGWCCRRCGSPACGRTARRRGGRRARDRARQRAHAGRAARRPARAARRVRAGRAAWQALWRREGARASGRVRGACSTTRSGARARARRVRGRGGRRGGRARGRRRERRAGARVRRRARAGGRLRVDLAGTAPRVAGNVNCPRAVARAAAVFALRTLLDDDVPTNDGVARALDLVVPTGCAPTRATARPSPPATSRCRSAWPT
jgi:N-methylhydantoinase B